MADGVTSSLTNAIIPVMAVVSRGADKVIQVVSIAAADIGSVASAYLGPSGTTTDINQASIVSGTDAIVLVGTSTVGETATVAISAGVRPVTTTVAGVVVGGAYQVVATSAPPAGYALHDAFASATNTLKVNVTAPLLAIGASYSIPIKVYRLS